MKRNFRYEWKADPGSLTALPILGAAGGALGILLVLVIMIIVPDTEDWFCMGTLLSLVATFGMSIIIYGTNFSKQFTLSVSMGQTRRSVISYYFLRQTILLVLGYGLVLLIHQGEMALYSALYPGIPQKGNLNFLYHPMVALGLIGGNLLVVLLNGMLYHKYGQRYFAISYFGMLGVLLLITKLDKIPWLQKAVAAVPTAAWYIMAAAVVAGMIWGIARMVRTLAVK